MRSRSAQIRIIGPTVTSTTPLNPGYNTIISRKEEPRQRRKQPPSDSKTRLSTKLQH